MTRFAARLLFAPTLMVAFAVLVKGYATTGDGFAAGVIAALAFVMQFVAFGERDVRDLLHTRYAPWVAVSGLALSLALTFIPVARGEAPLTHEPAPGASVVHLGSIELITAFAFDIGVFLLVTGFSVTAISLLARAEHRGRR
ncbi:MAG: MnhB domain-containing protein [Thermomicrobiales bacterium]